MSLAEIFLFSGIGLLCFVQGLRAQGAGSLGCVKCSSNNDNICGMQASFGKSVPQNLQQFCAVGVNNCYTLVTVSPGSPPYIKRGCGLINCTQIPQGTGVGDVCDDNSQVGLPTVGAVNQSRIFSIDSQGRGQTSVLQYCQTQLCNAGLIGQYSLPNYFIIQSNTGQTLFQAQTTFLLISFFLTLFRLF